jgi:hypothetical protein
MQSKKTEKELLALEFADGIARLEGMQAGLKEADLDRCREPGKWIVPQIKTSPG